MLETDHLELEERNDIIMQGKSVHSMAIHEAMGKMVVSRKVVSKEGSPSDDVIEQYNLLSGWLAVPEKVIAPSNGGIESVCFVGSYVLCSHLNGSITVADPHSDFLKRIQVCPAPLWAACELDHQRAALVSHSAILYVYGIKEQTIQWSLALGIDNRLFSVTSRNDVIAVGASDSVMIIKNGTIKHTLKVERKEKRLPTIVWSLCFVKDTVLASGDSRGVISFWNFETGSLIGSLESHQADILCLSMSEGNLYAAGVDPRIMTIKEIGLNDFRVVQKRNGPIRDVKALCSYDDKIYAAGEDHEIYVGKSGCQPVKQQWNKQIYVGGSMTMSRGETYVDLWTCGKEEKTSKIGDAVVTHQPLYLARIYTPEKNPLIACDISKDGNTIILSSSVNTTAYRLNPKNKLKPIIKCKMEARSANAVKVLDDFALLASGDFEILRVSLDGGEAEQILEQSGCGSISQLAVSCCHRYAAVITSRSQVFAIDIKKGESRALRVELPVDVTFTDGDSLFILTAAAGFDEPEATKKVLYEFPAAGGSVRRSASALALFGSTGIRPISIDAGLDDRLLVLTNDGQWVVINKSRDIVLGPHSTFLNNDADRYAAVHFRNANRICSCHIQSSTPLTAPFKLRKFGHQ